MSKTTSWCPALRRFLLMGLPMIPNPMNPILLIVVHSFCLSGKNIPNHAVRQVLLKLSGVCQFCQRFSNRLILVQCQTAYSYPAEHLAIRILQRGSTWERGQVFPKIAGFQVVVLETGLKFVGRNAHTDSGKR